MIQPLIKFGVDISRLTRETRRGLDTVWTIYDGRGETLIITSTYEGDHSAGSLHYANQAFDARPAVHRPGDTIKVLRTQLGKNWDVVIESNHWHFEYDPKGQKGGQK